MALVIRERSVLFPGRGVSADAEYVVIIEPTRKVSGLTMIAGSEEMRQFEPKLRELEFPLEFPDEQPLRLVMNVVAKCAPAEGCAAFLQFPRRAELPN